MDRETIEFFQPIRDSINRELADVAHRADLEREIGRLRHVMSHYAKGTADLLDKLTGESVSMRDAIEDLQRRMADVERRLPPEAAA